MDWIIKLCWLVGGLLVCKTIVGTLNPKLLKNKETGEVPKSYAIFFGGTLSASFFFTVAIGLWVYDSIREKTAAVEVPVIPAKKVAAVEKSEIDTTVVKATPSPVTFDISPSQLFTRFITRSKEFELPGNYDDPTALSKGGSNYYFDIDNRTGFISAVYDTQTDKLASATLMVNGIQTPGDVALAIARAYVLFSATGYENPSEKQKETLRSIPVELVKRPGAPTGSKQVVGVIHGAAYYELERSGNAKLINFSIYPSSEAKLEALKNTRWCVAGSVPPRPCRGASTAGS